MSKVTLVTGGARSGKSVYGEQLALTCGGDNVLYIATSVIVDEEIKERVKKHLERRPLAWETEERYKNLIGLNDLESFRFAKVILFDCIGFGLNNLLYDVLLDWDNPDDSELSIVECKIIKELGDLISLCRKEGKDLVMITNEVGDSLVPENRISRTFRDLLGKANCFAAAKSDSVILMTCGLSLELKEGR